MLEPLTDLERGILEYLIEYLRRNTYQPSIREIGRRFDIKSTKTVSEYLQSLADKGWIERDPSRSRGIRVLGLELDTDTVSVPLYEAASGAPAAVAAPRQFSLDRSLVGSTRAAFIPMPDASLTGIGIHEGDLLLVIPTAPEELEPGDIVVTTLAGRIRVFRWNETGDGAEYGDLDYQDEDLFDHELAGPLLAGRVTAIFRHLRVPARLVAAHDDAEADVHAPVT